MVRWHVIAYQASCANNANVVMLVLHTKKNFIYDTVVVIRFLGSNYKTRLFCMLEASMLCKLCLDD